MQKRADQGTSSDLGVRMTSVRRRHPIAVAYHHEHDGAWVIVPSSAIPSSAQHTGGRVGE